MVYELRTYWANPGKIDALHTRFSQHTIPLFEKHGMTVVAFWTPQDGRELHGDLVYLLAFPSTEERHRMFNAFRDDPVWHAAKSASEVDGILVEKLDSVLLDPTVYSPLQ
ncbi:MAG: hypothetical protein RLY87_800 [Chloroflexota bacterium]|jgi:hypothetical protein